VLVCTIINASKNTLNVAEKSDKYVAVTNINIVQKYINNRIGMLIQQFHRLDPVINNIGPLNSNTNAAIVI